jgi:hypothetical protein
MRPGRHLAAILTATLAIALPVDAAVPPATWTPTTAGPTLSFHSMAFAPSTCSVVAFGGARVEGGPDGSTLVVDPGKSTWLFDPGKGSWTSVALPRRGAPPTRFHARMAWDPGLGRLVMFGGRTSTTDLQDTWAFDPVGRAWSPLVTSCRRGTICPPARNSHGMVWSSVLRRILMFGGETGEMARNDLWAFNGRAWSQLKTTGAPSPRYYFGMAEDAASGKIVLLGGIDDDNGLTDGLTDTWILDPARLTWTKARGSVVPEPSNGLGMAWVPSIGAVVATGGAVAPSCSTGARTSWAFDVASETWTQLQTTGGPPTPRVNAYLVTDTCRGSAVFYGMPGNQIVPLPKETDYTWILK